MSFRNIFSFLETSTVKCGLWWEKAGLRRLQLSMNTVPLPGGSTGAGAVGWEESFPHEEVTGLLLLLWSVSHYSCFDAGLASESCDFRRGWLWIPSFVATSGPVQTDCYRGRLRIRNKPKCEKRF